MTYGSVGGYGCGLPTYDEAAAARKGLAAGQEDGGFDGEWMASPPRL